MTKTNGLEAGAEVRLTHDPGRRGVLSGKTRSHAGNTIYQVIFPEGKSYYPEYEIELINEGDDDPYVLLERGQFGRAQDLRRHLTHVQLSGRLANLIYSMETTNTDFLAYQFKPVLSFLESPSKGILIADEVGLGKTIEAGLVWTELRARFDARRLVVVCPAMLREKWQSELKKRFAVDAKIVNASELLAYLKQEKHEITDGQGIVCSIQGIRPPSGGGDGEPEKKGPRKELAEYLESQSEEDDLIDLLIVDEAHYLRNPESQTAKLGGLLREVSENIVLLSATPVNLKDEDLFHLLKIVDPDSFDDPKVFPQVMEANEPLQRGRSMALDTTVQWDDIKVALEEASQHSLLSDNQQLRSLLNDYGSIDISQEGARIRLADKIERINLLRHVVNRTRKVDVTEWRVVREAFSYFVDIPDEGHERWLYETVTDAIRRYAVSHDVVEGFLLASPQRQMSSCMYAAVKAWKSRVGSFEEQVYEDFGIEGSTSATVSPLIEYIYREISQDVSLDRLWKADTKYNKLRQELVRYLTNNPREKIVVFSYFRGTLSYLASRLEKDGIRSAILMGGMEESKQSIIDNFQSNDDLRILLSSEVASEGVDLQFARVLVNYDLPWNPMKIEQRIGRIDRIGQKADKISIWNLGFKDTIDERIYERLFNRLRIFERALGGMEAVLGDKVAELSEGLFRDQLSEEQEAERIDKTALALEKIRADNEALEDQASHLIAHAGYIMEKVNQARALNRKITDRDLFVYVKDYLDRFGEGHVLRHIDETDCYEIRLPNQLAASLEEFVRKKRLHGQTRLSGGSKVICRFSNRVRDPFSREEMISQFHPLVRYISHDLSERKELSIPLIGSRLERSEDLTIDSGIYGFVVRRWTFSGLSTEEEIQVRMRSLEDGKVLSLVESWEILNAARLNGEDWLSVANSVDSEVLSDVHAECEHYLHRDFLGRRRDKEQENADRTNFQIESAKKRRNRELETLGRVLEEHIKKGNRRLVAPTKGRMEKVKDRFEAQVSRFTQRRDLYSSETDIFRGVILIQ